MLIRRAEGEVLNAQRTLLRRVLAGDLLAVDQVLADQEEVGAGNAVALALAFLAAVLRGERQEELDVVADAVAPGVVGGVAVAAVVCADGGRGCGSLYIHYISSHSLRAEGSCVSTVGAAVAVADSIGWVMVMHEQALEISCSEYCETYDGSGRAARLAITAVPGSRPKMTLPSCGISTSASASVSSRLSIFGYCTYLVTVAVLQTS